ncbi:MAG: PHB depolymerase family esterase [Pseudomonadota bacterium]
MGRFFLANLALGVAVWGAAVTAEPRIFTHDGLDRLVWMDDARSDTSSPAPLVIALHGYRRPTDADALRNDPARLAWPDLQALGKQYGFVTLYPAAYRGQWSLFDGLSHAQKDDGTPIDDEDFLLSLVSQLVSNGTADPAAIYLTGISDGAIMTYRMICLSQTPFAAAVPLIGTAFAAHLADCVPKTPPALMHVHGTLDRVLPYDGWIFASGREVSVPEVTEHFRQLHGCTGQDRQMLENLDPDDGSRVEEMTWTGCTRDGTVLRYKVIGGGHDVPSPDADQPTAGQKINRDLDTMSVMWTFFQANPRAD